MSVAVPVATTTAAAATAVGGVDAKTLAHQIVRVVHLCVIEERSGVRIDQERESTQLQTIVALLGLVESHRKMSGAAAATATQHNTHSICFLFLASGFNRLLQLIRRSRGHGQVHGSASLH